MPRLKPVSDQFPCGAVCEVGPKASFGIADLLWLPLRRCLRTKLCFPRMRLPREEGHLCSCLGIDAHCLQSEGGNLANLAAWSFSYHMIIFRNCNANFISNDSWCWLFIRGRDSSPLVAVPSGRTEEDPHAEARRSPRPRLTLGALMPALPSFHAAFAGRHVEVSPNLLGQKAQGSRVLAFGHTRLG